MSRLGVAREVSFQREYPELAGEIREVFPVMATNANITIQDDSLTGDESGDFGRPILKAPVAEQLLSHHH